MKRSSAQAIHQLFDLDPRELLFTDFSCSMLMGIIYFGRLFLSQNHVCFYASFFAVKQKLVIDLEKITSIERREGTIQIEWKSINTQGVQHTQFSGFQNVEAVASLLKALWQGEQVEGVDLSQQDTCIQVNLADVPQDKAKKSSIMSATIPISVQDFYSFFLADDATLYSFVDHFSAQGATDITLTPWKKDEQLGAEVRQLQAFIKVKGVPFKSRATLVALHMLKRTEQSFSLSLLTKIQDVPFSNCFKVEKQWKVSGISQNQSRLQTECEIKWQQNCYLKATIETRTFEDVIEDQKKWIDNAKAKLAKTLGGDSLFDAEFEKETSHEPGSAPSHFESAATSYSSGHNSTQLQLLFVMVSLLCVLNLVVLATHFLG